MRQHPYAPQHAVITHTDHEIDGAGIARPLYGAENQGYGFSLSACPVHFYIRFGQG